MQSSEKHYPKQVLLQQRKQLYDVDICFDTGTSYVVLNLTGLNK